MTQNDSQNGELLAGKVVVVVGGAGLLGKAFCEAIVKQKGTVIVADADIKAASEVAKYLNEFHQGYAEPFFTDITSQSSVDKLISFMDTRYSDTVQGVVNSAYPKNSHYGAKAENVLYEDFCDNLSLHLGGYFLVAQRFALFFQQQGRGVIINMGSIYGMMAPRFSVYEKTLMTMPVEYAAIKSGVHGLTRYFAKYLKKSGVRVNTLSPGGVLDNQDPSFLEKYGSFCNSKGMLEPKDIAGALVFLLSDMARYVTGQNLVVDDGFSL